MNACKRCGLGVGGDGWHADAAECLEAALRRINNVPWTPNMPALDLQEAAESCVLSGRVKVRDALAIHIAFAYLIGLACGFGMALVVRWTS